MRAGKKKHGSDQDFPLGLTEVIQFQDMEGAKGKKKKIHSENGSKRTEGAKEKKREKKYVLRKYNRAS